MLHSVGQVVSNGKPEPKQGNSHKKAQETQKYLVNLVPFCGYSLLISAGPAAVSNTPQVAPRFESPRCRKRTQCIACRSACTSSAGCAPDLRERSSPQWADQSSYP